MEPTTTDPVTAEQTLVLRFAGVLDTAASLRTPELTNAVTALSAPAAVVLDIRAVESLSRAAADAVVAFGRTHAARGVDCRVVWHPATTSVADELSAADPDGELPRYARIDDALAHHSPDSAADTGVDARLLAQFEVLTRTLLGVTTVAEALEQVVDAVDVVVPGADLVSVTLRDPDKGFHTPIQTDPVASALDQVQYRTSQGPCLDSARESGPSYTVSDDLSVETRWPQFAAAAAGHGYRSILSLELHPANGGPSGALNIYSRRTSGFTAADRHAAFLLAGHASLALAHTRATELADLEQVRMSRAIDSRDVIGQAKGILMNRQGISAEEAFDLLRRTSQDLNVKLVEVARTLTTRHSELDDADRPV